MGASRLSDFGKLEGQSAQASKRYCSVAATVHLRTGLCRCGAIDRQRSRIAALLAIHTIAGTPKFPPMGASGSQALGIMTSGRSAAADRRAGLEHLNLGHSWRYILYGLLPARARASRA